MPIDPEKFKKYLSEEREEQSQSLLAMPVEQKEVVYRPPQRNPVIVDMETEVLKMGKGIRDLTPEERRRVMLEYDSKFKV